MINFYCEIDVVKFNIPSVALAVQQNMYTRLCVRAICNNNML